MNLIEAIKSGRPYRRKAWGDSLNWREAFRPHRGNEGYCERYDDLLADDWEIQEPSVTVTRAQFWDAWLTVKGETDCIDGNKVAERLGLGETGDSK